MVYFIFKSNFNRTFCKQIVETLISICPTKRALGLNGFGCIHCMMPSLSACKVLKNELILKFTYIIILLAEFKDLNQSADLSLC